MHTKKLWFKAKKYGYGWYPCAWEGVVCLVVYVCLVGLLITLIDFSTMKGVVLYFSLLALFTIILFVICAKKGERARWRWGK